MELGKARYEEARDKAAKRVIAAICAWLDKLGYKFETRNDKIRYALSMACRAANCANFNAIPESKLTAIYNLFLGPLQSKRHFFDVFASSVPLIFTGLPFMVRHMQSS